MQRGLESSPEYDGPDTATKRAGMEIKAQALVQALEKEAERRVTAKQPIEKRWIEESFQYHGRYLHHEEEAIKSSQTMNKSFVYMNETRRKSDAVEDRLIDIEFPTDDRNFSSEATTVPELSDEALAWSRFAAQNQQMLLQVPDGAPEAQAAIEAQREGIRRATEVQAIIDEAGRRAAAMQDEMDDQLNECSYNHQCKLMAHDACKLGTGIIKGPVLSSYRKRTWQQRQDELSGFVVHEMQEVDEPRPAFYRVDPWNWFPDMDATCLEESESFYERHLMTASALKKLAKTEGFNADAIRRLIKQKARGVAPQYLSDLRSITGNDSSSSFKDKYHVWEYHGPIDSEDMHCVSSLYGDADMEDYADEVDALSDIQITMWFCQGEVLKFGIHPLDTGEPLYSVFNYKRDDHSIFGFGVPHIMANPQKVLCAAWRMMVDNAALATAPQIIFNNGIVEPYDGDYVITPGKLWLKKSGTAPGERVFETYHLDIRQVELQAIINLALESIDREVGIPSIVDAQPGSAPMQTALGVSVFNADAKIPFKALTKSFDDNITIPNMRRLHQWNMQFSSKEHIKGDMRVKARGTSTFLLRELQAPGLMTMILQFANHPVLGPALQMMPMVRKLAQAMFLRPDEVVKSDEKIAADLAAAARDEQPEPTPEEIKAQTEQMRSQALLEAAKIKAEVDRYVADQNYKMKQMDLQMSSSNEMEKLRADMDKKSMELRSKERQQAADIGLTAKMGKPTGGGWA